MKPKTIHRFREKIPFSLLDLHFKSFIEKIAGKERSKVSLAAALVSHYKAAGHICVALSSDMEVPLSSTELRDWLITLRNSSAVGSPGEYKPLILDDKSRLYLYRYWDYQDKLARLILKRVNETESDVDFHLLEQGLKRYFPSEQNDPCLRPGTDWQKVAAFIALFKRFCVISGGPGTGKTTTVAKILALLLEQNISLKIALAAPTGKAAARLQDAITREKAKAAYRDVREAIPDEASTLHRLLGGVPNSPYFRHNPKNRLSADVVVVDEASMVDMALMSKLVQALYPETRLILLGDKDQLASVEAGAALGDICDAGDILRFSRGFCNRFRPISGDEPALPLNERNGKDEPGIGDCILQLQTNYRFGEESGIRAVSQAVNSGDANRGLERMKTGEYPDIRWRSLPSPENLEKAIRETVVRGFEPYLKAIDEEPSECFRLFEQFRILCALRRGHFGVGTLNRAAEKILKERNLINPDNTWYKGRPVLVTSNDYNLRLFNGDVGITLPDQGVLRVFFQGADGSVKKLHPLRLPEHETVYAMTVHKSQGSEFDTVVMVLPDKDFPVLTRELIYTGITRAVSSVEVWGKERVFRDAVLRRIQRTSGLSDALKD